jgi:hypothetical protein
VVPSKESDWIRRQPRCHRTLSVRPVALRLHLSVNVPLSASRDRRVRGLVDFADHLRVMYTSSVPTVRTLVTARIGRDFGSARCRFSSLNADAVPVMARPAGSSFSIRPRGQLSLQAVALSEAKREEGAPLLALMTLQRLTDQRLMHFHAETDRYGALAVSMAPIGDRATRVQCHREPFRQAVGLAEVLSRVSSSGRGARRPEYH